LKLGDLLWAQLLFLAEFHTPFLRLLDAILLPLGAYLRLELSDGPQHIEKQTARRVAGVDILVKHLETHPLALQLGRNLAQMKRRTSQPIQTRYNEHIPFPDIF
jgi:hypothetical protein